MQIDGWNIEENREWWVRLTDDGAGILAGLYLTQADAEGETNRQASGVSFGYGSGLPVILEPEAGAVAYLQPELGYHLKVSGQALEPAAVIRIGRFIELPEIAHPIYRDAGLIERRARAEIDAGTHARITRTVELGGHLPELEAGELARLSSERRGLDLRGQVAGHRIAGDLHSIRSTVDLVAFLELHR